MHNNSEECQSWWPMSDVLCFYLNIKDYVSPTPVGTTCEQMIGLHLSTLLSLRQKVIKIL